MTEIIKASFNIDKNNNVSGVMDCKTSSKKFSCWSSEFFNIENHSNVYGKTAKNEHISLLNCLSNEAIHSRNNESSYSCEIYSHVMLIGKDKVVPEKDKFISISLTVGNPLKLFRHLKSFGYINFPDSKFIDALNEQEYTPQFNMDSPPIIAYFSGNFDIFEQNTKLGIIKAHNLVSSGVPGNATGVKIENKVIVTICFHYEVSINEAFKIANSVSLFLRFIGGKGLFFKDISLRKAEDEQDKFIVYHDNYKWGTDEEDDYDSDPLIDVTNREFPELLRSWFDKNNRVSVRNSFYNTYFRKVYSPDRLITAANMFDIFPIADDDKKKPIPPDVEALLQKLKIHVKSEFSGFSDIKKSLLQSIGYISRKSLKERVLERIEILRPHLVGHKVPVKDLEFIIGIAIKSRNYYVHGSEYKKLTPEQLFEFQSLFIDTFEYIYAISELVECGWRVNDVPIWTNHHRIRHYEQHIDFNIRRLKNVVNV